VDILYISRQRNMVADFLGMGTALDMFQKAFNSGESTHNGWIVRYQDTMDTFTVHLPASPVSL
jgi:hypothetical protein